MAKTKVKIISGDKGGVGKSLVCNIIADIKIADKEDIVLIDSDTQNPDISWTYQKITTVHLIDLKDHAGWMDLADLLSKNKGKEIIISMPAGIGFHIQEEIEFFADVVKALDIDLHMYFPIDRLKTSLLLLKKAIETFDGLMPVKNITVVKNGFFGTEEKFYRWETSKLKENFVKKGGKEVFISELHERVIDEIERVPFSVALKNKDLSFSNKIELERWYKEVKAVLTNKKEK